MNLNVYQIKSKKDDSVDIKNYQMRDINCFFLSQVAMGSDKLVYRMPNTKVHGLMDFKMVTDQRHMLILVSLFFAIHKTRYQKISSIKKFDCTNLIDSIF